MSRAVVVLASCTCLMGCLITREPSFEEPRNLPPSVHGSTETPMYQVRVEPTGAGVNPEGDGGASSSEILIRAVVRDPNPRDELIGRTFINLDRESPIASLIRDEIPIPPDLDDDPFSRDVTFTIPRGRLAPGCNWIELHVSRDFEGLPSLLPAEMGDIGTGVWFIAGQSSMGTSVDMLTCDTPGEEL